MGAGAHGPTEPLTFSEVNERELSDFPEKGTYFMNNAYLTRVGGVKQDAPVWFAACGGGKCGKKAIGDESSGYNCESCGWSGTEPTWRFILNLTLADGTGQVYATAFNDMGAALLGKQASAVLTLSDPPPASPPLPLLPPPSPRANLTALRSAGGRPQEAEGAEPTGV